MYRFNKIMQFWYPRIMYTFCTIIFDKTTEYFNNITEYLIIKYIKTKNIIIK